MFKRPNLKINCDEYLLLSYGECLLDIYVLLLVYVNNNKSKKLITHIMAHAD